MSILSERRSFQPYGMAGGMPGSRGLNILIMQDNNGNDKVINLGGKNTVHVNKGFRLQIYSPGGGGYGVPNTQSVINANIRHADTSMRMSSGSLNQYTLNQESV